MTRGPTPKRSDERRRRNKARIDRTPNHTAAPLGPPCPDWVTGLARQWYESLRTSGQAVYYADSDWQVALLVCRAIETFEAKPSGSMLRQIMSAMRSLAATEGDRRSLRIELRHLGVVDEDEIAAVAALESVPATPRSRRHHGSGHVGRQVGGAALGSGKTASFEYALGEAVYPSAFVDDGVAVGADDVVQTTMRNPLPGAVWSIVSVDQFETDEPVTWVRQLCPPRNWGTVTEVAGDRATVSGQPLIVVETGMSRLEPR